MGNDVGYPATLVVPGDAPRFVGRHDELDRLLSSWQHVRDAAGRRAVFVGGEPGVGKTRLAIELATRANAEGATVVCGWCDEDIGLPYQPFVEAVRTLVDAIPELATTERIGRSAAELQRLVPELGHGAGAPLQADPEAELFALFEAVVTLFAAAEAAAPLVVVLEDLQWAARPTVLLLRHLLRSARLRRTMIVGTYRDSEVGGDHLLGGLLAELRREHGIDRIVLGGLDVDAVVELASSSAIDHDLAVALHARTAGNPFFVGEVLRQLRDADGTGGTDAADANAGLGIPESVREVVDRRIGRMSADAVRAVTVGAVIGPTFSLRLLEALPDAADDPERLLDALDEAIAQRILVEIGTHEYALAHAFFRDALLAGISATRRARLHHRIAEAIERITDDEGPVRAGELAQHYLASADPAVLPRVASFATRAGEQALGALAAQDAVRWYSMALDAVEREPDELVRARCLVGLGHAQRQCGDPDARATLLAAADLAKRIGNAQLLASAALHNSRGFASETGAVDTERVATIEDALDLVGPGDSALRARLLALLAVELTFSTDVDRRITLAADALEIARRLDDPAVLAEVLDRRLLAIWMPSTLAQRIEETAEAEVLAERTGNLHANFWACYHRSIASLEGGDVPEMVRCSTRVGELAAAIGQPAVRWAAAMNESWQALLVGDTRTAVSLARESLELGFATGQPDAAAMYGALMTGVRVTQGRLSELAPTMDEAVASNPGIPALRAVRALATLEAAMPDQARAQLHAETTTGFTIPLDPVWLATVAIWSEVASRLADRGAAEMLRTLLLPWHDQVAFSGATVQGSVSHALGCLAAVAGDRAGAEQHFTDAAAMNERLRAPFLTAQTLLEHGRFLLDDPAQAARGEAHLRRALVLAVEHGYGGIEARARETVS